MLPDAQIIGSFCRGEFIPHFLGAEDHPWLRVLLDEHARFPGRPQRELDERLREPLHCVAPDGKRRLAANILLRITRARAVAEVPPRAARVALFAEAARRGAGERSATIAAAAAALAVGATSLMQSLFADLPGERIVVSPSTTLTPSDVVLAANLALAQALLFRAAHVSVTFEGNARAVVRQAKLRGLLCTVVSSTRTESSLQISGPIALFHRTTLYGRRLAELLAPLAWSSRFLLTAECVVRNQPCLLRLASGQPPLSSKEPRAFDSRLEVGFARDFAKAAPDWDVVREPEPFPADGTLIFPDFALSRRDDPSDRWLLEIIGFWTPDYLSRKLARLRAARMERLILCIDDDLNCADDDLPAAARVVRFRRRIDPQAVLSLIERHHHAALSV